MRTLGGEGLPTKEGDMVAEENDKELVRRAKSGDHQAFAQLVEENQNRVYSLAFRITGDREESADLAQEAFLKAWQALPNFQGESSFATWVYRLTTNLCIDYIRRQQRRRETVSAVSLDDSDSPFPEPADPGQDPHRALEQTELRRAVERGLQALPEAQRQVLVRPELSGDRGAAGPGPGDSEVPHRPGPAGAEKNFAAGRELFWHACV